MQGPQNHYLYVDPDSDTSCVTLGKRLNLSVPRPSYLQNGDGSSVHLTEKL